MPHTHTTHRLLPATSLVPALCVPHTLTTTMAVSVARSEDHKARCLDESPAVRLKAAKQRLQLDWTKDVVLDSGPLHGECVCNACMQVCAIPASHKTGVTWRDVADTKFNHEFFKEFASCASFLDWNLDDVFDKLRVQFGERVGIYFVFLHFYTRWLVPLTVGMVVYYVCLRWTSWQAYT